MIIRDLLTASQRRRILTFLPRANPLRPGSAASIPQSQAVDDCESGYKSDSRRHLLAQPRSNACYPRNSIRWQPSSSHDHHLRYRTIMASIRSTSLHLARDRMPPRIPIGARVWDCRRTEADRKRSASHRREIDLRDYHQAAEEG